MTGSTDPTLLNALHIQSWRGYAQLTALNDTQAARNVNSSLTFTSLQAAWQGDQSNWHGEQIGTTWIFLYASSPWDNWDTFNTWVAGYLAKVEAANELPTYWDLMNECDAQSDSASVITGPVGQCYYHSATYGTPPSQALIEDELYYLYYDILAYYQAHNLGTPRFVMPSVSGFNTVSTTVGTTPLPLDSLLTWSDGVTAPTGFAPIHWDAVSWHEIQCEGAFENSNSAMPTHLEQAQVLLAQHPSAVGAQIFVNENGVANNCGSNTATEFHAGWDVGRIWAMETGGAAAANRSCWADPDHPSESECYDGSLDGLLSKAADGTESIPRSVWWDRCEYARMGRSLRAFPRPSRTRPCASSAAMTRRRESSSF